MYRFGFGFQHSSPVPTLDFDELFTRENIIVEQILDTPSIVEEVRMSSDSFSGHLKDRLDLVYGLMDYAVRPELQQQKKGNFPVRYIAMPLSYPFIAIELLCGQNQRFLDFILGIKNGATLTTSVDGQQSSTSEKNKPKADFDSPLDYMFRFLETSDRINETAAGYLLRFLSQLQYQKGSEVLFRLIQLFQFFEMRPQITTNVISHSYSKSLTDIFSKLFSVETEEFTARKHILINKIFASFEKEQRARELSERLENFIFLLEDLAEKCQDRYDGARFISLLGKSISPVNTQILANILLKNADDEQVLLPGLDILTMFLTFYKTEKLKQSQKNNEESIEESNSNTMVAEQVQQSNIINNDVLLTVESLTNKLLHKFEGKELNIDWAKQEQLAHSKMNGKPQIILEQPTHLQITNKQKKEEDMLSEPTTTINNSKTEHIEEEQVEIKKPQSPSQNNSESLLLEETPPVKPKFKFSQLKLFIIVQDLIILEPKNSNFEEELLTVSFVRYAIKLMEEHPQNNLMHNTLKNILIKGITGKIHTAQVICSKRAGLLKFIIDAAARETKSGHCYMNQLHHISATIESIRQRNSDLAHIIANENLTWNSYINGAYAETIKAHTRLLGGEDPKKRSDICMSAFYTRFGKSEAITITKKEVEDVKHHSNGPEKGEMGDDEDEENDENHCLGIDSDEEKDNILKEPSRKNKRGMALYAFLNKEQVKSEDEDTVRIEEDTIPIPMEIEAFCYPAAVTNNQKTESVVTSPPVKQTLTDDPPAQISDTLHSAIETQKKQQI